MEITKAEQNTKQSYNPLSFDDASIKGYHGWIETNFPGTASNL
jgi:hypothetical protein